MFKKVDPVKVAHYFLRKANGRLTPLQVQKLVYYAHGWSLAVFDAPLSAESVEVWPYGPAVASVYHEFKQYGANIIGRYSRKELNGFSPEQEALLDRVWDQYGNLDGIQLSMLTHKPGSPWDKAFQNHERFIREQLIKDYFLDLIKRSEDNEQ